jgi:tRNA threonylcarbamoyladenosine biosynthesis protein TsaB
MRQINMRRRSVLTLAIDQATKLGSAAVLQDDTLLAARQWEEHPLCHQSLFEELQKLLEKAACTVADINLFGVNIGPGSFTGIRMAVSALRAMALPGRQPVIGITCGEALTVESIIGNHWRLPVAVVGDARRDRFWFGRFETAIAPTSMRNAYTLVDPAELGQHLADIGVVITSDWDRIGPQLIAVAPPTCEVIQSPRYPDAAIVARLAWSRHQRGGPFETPLPIYMNPAVAVKARG